MSLTTCMPGRVLADQALKVYRHIERTGSISARDAMDDYSMTSATLARRICDLEVAGFYVTRVRKQHPISGLRYTRYEFVA
jgi:DNA-binding MarR family transcriptional regulator